MEFTKIKIAIIGLGYVGLPLAVEFGKKYNTLGFDLNENRIKELKEGLDITLEVDKKMIMESSKLELSCKEESLEACNVYIVTVPTPIDNARRPNLEPLTRATQTLSKFIKKGDTIIYESTVYPGCTEEICVPILEKFSGLSYNKDFFCGYSPERINPGDKVNTLTKITKITSGSTEEISSKIDNLYKSIIPAGTYLAPSIKVAEAAKVIENTQRDLNIALVNELSMIFEKLNIDTMEVLEAAGSKWNFLPFKPGLVGGHCIGVDPYYLTHKAEQVGYNPQVILAGRRINDNMAKFLVNQVVKHMTLQGINISESVVGVMGITFKENCPDIRNTKIIDVINELKGWGINVKVSDPWADKDEVKSLYDIDLEKIDNNNKVDTLIVAVGHQEYRELSTKTLRDYCIGDNPIIADVKSIYKKEDLIKEGFNIYRL